VFGTHNHENTLVVERHEKLFRYIFGILNNKKCFVYKIGGVENHIHIILSLHPMVSLSGLIKDIKLATSDWIKKEKIFSNFNGWQKGYGAFSYSIDAKEKLIEYVENQVQHHETKTFREEYLELLKMHRIEYDEKYLE
jgi:REP element-mobilizing transposase RayT